MLIHKNICQQNSHRCIPAILYSETEHCNNAGLDCDIATIDSIVTLCHYDSNAMAIMNAKISIDFLHNAQLEKVNSID